MRLLRKKTNTPRLSLHIITMNRAGYLERTLYKCWWCFDKIRVCDGGSEDDTLDVCKKFGCEVIENEWKDDMSEQHNCLLERAKEGEWIFILDDDEYPSDQLMYRFRELISTDESTLYRIPSMMEVDGVLQCPVPEMIDKIKHGHEQFMKDIFFQYHEYLYYEGVSHYALKGFVGKSKSLAEPIIHSKTPEDIIWCDVYQGFINPETQGYGDDDGKRMKDAFENVGVTDVKSLKAYLESGNISSELKEMFFEWKSPENSARSRWYQWYFLVLHPEELPEVYGMRNEAIIRHVRDKGGFQQEWGYESVSKSLVAFFDEIRRQKCERLV